MKLQDCFKERLLRKIKPSKSFAIKSLQISLEYIEKSKDNLKMKNNDIVIFCSYTAMFHAARALLFKDGIKERSHICIVSYLKETYPNLRQLANKLDIYRLTRHNTLYALDFLIPDGEAKTAIKDAEQFYKWIKKMIK